MSIDTDRLAHEGDFMKTVLLLVTALAGLGVKQTPAYTEEDLYYMSHIVQAEAGYCSTEMQEGVASVVMNRVESDLFPDTVMEVVTQAGQYAPITNGTFWSEPTDEAIEVSIDILENGSKYPEDVLYQSNYIQGPIYKSISTSYSTMYFCYQ